MKVYAYYNEGKNGYYIIDIEKSMIKTREDGSMYIIDCLYYGYSDEEILELGIPIGEVDIIFNNK